MGVRVSIGPSIVSAGTNERDSVLPPRFLWPVAFWKKDPAIAREHWNIVCRTARVISFSEPGLTFITSIVSKLGHLRLEIFDVVASLALGHVHRPVVLHEGGHMPP